ncbi:MAG: tetratricopeptide repeat protein [Nannocystaceae bacterium]|nr:tetratricopeptide repeat protein [Nannocystaceae bacterium]
MTASASRATMLAVEMGSPDLRQRFEALRSAIAGKDPAGVQAALETIEAALEGADPLTRAAAYAQVQLLRGRPLDAAQVLDDVLAVIGDDARIQHRVGVYREQGGDMEGALGSYERACTTDPMFTQAWVSRGVVLDTRGEWAAALACYRSAMLADPQHVATWRNMGNCLAAQRKYDEAASAYDTALGLAVGDQTIAFLRASAHAAKGDLQTADRLLTDAIREELGRPVEERVGDAVCRFFVRGEDEPQRRARARELLKASGEGLPEGAHVVIIEAVRHICDEDPVRSGHPHRFLDASSLVSR